MLGGVCTDWRRVRLSIVSVNTKGYIVHEGMVIVYIYHRTNNYGHTNLGAFLLKYDRIMRYKQRHIIIKATPHDQSTLLVTCVE